MLKHNIWYTEVIETDVMAKQTYIHISLTTKLLDQYLVSFFNFGENLLVYKTPKIANENTRIPRTITKVVSPLQNGFFFLYVYKSFLILGGPTTPSHPITYIFIDGFQSLYISNQRTCNLIKFGNKMIQNGSSERCFSIKLFEE